MGILTSIGLIVSLLAPLALALALVLVRPATRTKWALSVWLTLALALFAGLTGAWYVVTYYLRAAMAAIVLVAVAASLSRWRHLFGAPGAGRTPPRAMVPYVLPATVFTALSVLALLGRIAPEVPVALEYPLRGGQYYVAQGGATAVVNGHHRYGSQAYAVDLLRLNAAGRSAGPLRPAALEDYAIYGEVIYSPCDGTVAAAVDGLDDQQPGSAGDPAHPAGNHVYLDCSAVQAQVLLAHMQSGSVAVTAGASLRSGDRVGRVGNSGNSTEPHLHIQTRTGGSLDHPSSGSGVPMLFNGRFLVRNDTIDCGPGLE